MSVNNIGIMENVLALDVIVPEKDKAIRETQHSWIKWVEVCTNIKHYK